MHTSFTTIFKNYYSDIKKYIPVLLLVITSSCAKEVYTNEDATNSKREAQKVGLTVMVRDIGNQATDMSGFTVSTSQCGEEVKGITSADGTTDLKLIKGDAVLTVKKDGYVVTTAVVTTNETDKERNNTVVIVPVFADTEMSGVLKGMVAIKIESSAEEPVADALVSIDVNMDELIRLAFPGLGANIDKYRPGALSYSATNLMQPVRTSASGAFQFAIPATISDLTYTVNVHETALTQGTFCSANQTVTTNGRNTPIVLFQLTPYEK